MREGLLAEFESPEGLRRAHERLRELGYSRIRCWSPYPVRGITPTSSPVPWWMLAGGMAGGGLGYLIQWWCNAYQYPLDVGGRPLHAAPAFIPITFESAVLAASLTGFFGLLALCGFPRLYHPTHTVSGFDRASVDRFWIGVDRRDPRYDDGLRPELERLGALRCERMGVLR